MSSDDTTHTSLQDLLSLTKALHTTLTGGNTDQQTSHAALAYAHVTYAEAWHDLAIAISSLGAFLSAFSISLEGSNPDELSALMGELHHCLLSATSLHQFSSTLGTLRALVYEVTVLTKLQVTVVNAAKMSLRRLHDAAQQVWVGTVRLYTSVQINIHVQHHTNRPPVAIGAACIYARLPRVCCSTVHPGIHHPHPTPPCCSTAHHLCL